MKDRDFDELLKERLKGYESPVAADMWERIIGKEKKRRFGFLLYWLLAGFMLFGISAIYYFQYGSRKNQPAAALDKEKPRNSPAKRDITSQPDDKIVSLKTPGTMKNDFPPNMYRDEQGKKQPKKRRHTKLKNDETEISVITPGSLQPGSNNDPGNDRYATNPDSSEADKTVKKNIPENKIATPDSSSTPETKPGEPEDDKFALELFASPQIAMTGISATDKSYEQVLRSAGNMQLSYTAGMRISYAITKRLYVKLGLQYTQVNEKMSFKDAQGNSFSGANHYKITGIPLLVGYRIIDRNNLRLYVNTGSILNIVSRYKGIIPSGSGQPVDIKDNDVYDKNVNASFFFGFDISKHMTRRTDVFIEPWLNYRLKNMVNRFYAFNQRIHSTGLSLGLRYRLFKNNAHEF